MNTSAAPPLFDRQAALHRLDGDLELFEMLIDVFQQDSVQLLRELDAAVSSGDFRAAERAAHSLKGLAANFEAAPACEAAYAVEQAAHGADDIDNLPTAIQDLQLRFCQLSEALR